MTTIRIATTLGAVGIAVLAAGCSTATKEAPSAPSSAPVVSPTEKAVVPPPPKAFNQNMNAADGKAALERQGYNVQINWGNGRQDRGLAACNISSVDGLRGDSPPAGTTVYLTVACP